jgi:DNA-binding transcriptional regulator of glucitol operon
MNSRRHDRKRAKEELERILLYITKVGFFVFGYYTVSRFLVNYFLANFTNTGWMFDWDFFGWFAPASKS